MMREHKVLAAGMDIDLIAEVTLCHDRALNMPARTTLAPCGIPVRLSVLFRFPEHKIGGVLLVLLTGNLQLTKT